MCSELYLNPETEIAAYILTGVPRELFINTVILSLDIFLSLFSERRCIIHIGLNQARRNI